MEQIKEWWQILTGLVAIAIAWATLKNKVENLEKSVDKERNDLEKKYDEKVGKLEKYVTELYVRADESLKFQSGQFEINKNNDRILVEIKTSILNIENLIRGKN